MDNEKKSLWDKLWSIELYRFPWGNDGRGTAVLLAPVLFMGIFIAGLLIFDTFFAG